MAMILFSFILFIFAFVMLVVFIENILTILFGSVPIAIFLIGLRYVYKGIKQCAANSKSSSFSTIYSNLTVVINSKIIKRVNDKSKTFLKQCEIVTRGICYRLKKQCYVILLNYQYYKSEDAKRWKRSIQNIKNDSSFKTQKPRILSKKSFNIPKQKFFAVSMIFALIFMSIGYYQHKTQQEINTANEALFPMALLIVGVTAAIGLTANGLQELAKSSDSTPGHSSSNKYYSSGNETKTDSFSIFSFGGNANQYRTCHKCYGSGKIDVIMGNGKEIERTCNICGGRGVIR